MTAKIHSSLVALVLSFLLPVASNAEELQPPALGSHMIWDCQGPFTSRYELKVVSITDNIVRYEGRIDDGNYFAEKHEALTGTSLWIRLFGGRRQWFDYEDFADYRLLRPGSRFKGPVPAEHNDDRWVWRYEITVGQARSISHDVLGLINVVPVSEERSVFHGDYWSRMTTLVMPTRGISVMWTYEDHKGKERCNLAEIRDDQG